MPEKYTDEELAKVEMNIVDALMEAASYRSGEENRRRVVIKRKDKILFSFDVEGLYEDTWRKCRRQSLINRNKRSEELDNARFLSMVIYEATVESDKKRLWNNQELWQKWNLVSGFEVVNRVLTPGEKSKVGEVIMDLSGYDDDLDDIIKNV